MRNAFIETLMDLADQDPRVLLLTGDLGYKVMEPFMEKFPDRFFNAGVAEQNMVGLATGLAEAGFIPFVYSIAPFAALRPYEFIRNGPVHHQLPVRIVGVGGGFGYGPNGISHFGLEDVGAMRLLPGLGIIAPADYAQAKNAFLATWNLPGPVYYRIGKESRKPVAGLEGRFELGRAQLTREGGDLFIFSMGGVAGEASEVAHILAGQGISCGMMVVASIAPPPHHDLLGALARVPVAMTVEPHYIVGGIGSLVSEIVAEQGLGCRVVRCGVRNSSGVLSGSPEYLHEMHGLSVKSLVKIATEAVKG